MVASISYLTARIFRDLNLSLFLRRYGYDLRRYDLVSGWSFYGDILHSAQMSPCYQYGYVEAFHIYCWR